MTLSDIADKHYQWLVGMGWTDYTPLESCGLIASEIGEAVDECEGNFTTEKFSIELTDIVLRCLGVLKKHGVDINKKMSAYIDSPEKLSTAEFSQESYKWMLRLYPEIVANNATEDCAKLLSEVSKATNACRGETLSPNFYGCLGRLAVRTMGIAVKYNVNIAHEIEAKLAKNHENGTRGRVK